MFVILFILLQVVLALLTRCIVKPAELISEGIGNCMRLLLSELPLHFQLLTFLVIIILLVLILVFRFEYHIGLPFWFSLKPGSKDASENKSKTENREVTNENRIAASNQEQVRKRLKPKLLAVEKKR